jgi:hypothetical protein
LTVNVQPGGQAVTVVAGPRSQLRRIPPEAAATFERTRASVARPNEARRTDNKTTGTQATTTSATPTTTAPPRASGQTMQELFRSLPTVAPTDLKKGDAVLVTGTPGADAQHLTAIILLTGEADFLNRLQQLGTRAGQNMSPGLPGDVLGGGIPAEPRDPREPPPQK